jgi:hypothetical protein
MTLLLDSGSEDLQERIVATPRSYLTSITDADG